VCQEFGGKLCRRALIRAALRRSRGTGARSSASATNRLCCLTPDAGPAVIASDRRPQHRPNLGWNATATRPGNAAAWDATPSLSGANTGACHQRAWYRRPGRLAVRIRRGESTGEPCPTNEASLCLRPQRSRRRPSRWRPADPPPRRPRCTGFSSGLEPPRAQPLALEAMRRRAEARSLSSRPATCPACSQLPLEALEALEGSPCAAMVQRAKRGGVDGHESTVVDQVAE
jgi:hypothetical protein